jgi:tRNA(Ser,Leu) C12 N-acetylase TAN1
VIALAKKKRAKTRKKKRKVMAKKKIKKKKVTKKKKAKVKRKKKPKKKVTKRRIKAKKKVKPKRKRLRKAKKKPVKKKKPKKAVGKPKKRETAAANLMVTYDPTHRMMAEAEVTDVFKRIEERIRFLKSEIEGVFKIKTSDAREAVKKVAKLCMAEPEIFRMTYQYVPIDKWCASSIDKMQEVIKDLEADIKSSEKWRMTLNKRSYDMPAIDLILALTDVVNKPHVDLRNPEKILRVEIFGDKAAIALLRTDESFSVMKFKGSG